MKHRISVFVVCAAILSSLSGTPASADSVLIDFPIRCGMTVDIPSDLHLEKDMYCAAPTAITVDPQATDTRVNLHGHKLYGSGSNVGVLGAYEIIDGRIEHFGDGLIGPERVLGVKLVDNDRALRCANCLVSKVYFKNNRTGLQILADGHGRVFHSSFVDNASGITINDFASSVSIDHSIFAGNTAGIEASRGTVRAGYSLFRRNRVGIDLVPKEQTDCAVVALTLERITYFENDKDVRGRPC